MRGVLVKRIVLLAVAMASMGASIGWSQSISGLQASYAEGSPADVTGITSGITFGSGGFILYINGSFTVANFQNVQWLNTSTNVTTTFSANVSVSASQIHLLIPNSLFATVVSSPVPVKVTVQESGGSAFAFFAINPPVAAITPILPAGTVNVPYSTPFFTGGSGPFDSGIAAGTLPPGLNVGSTTINGTPLQTGVYSFETVATDVWGSQAHGDDIIEIVAVPTITLVTPSNSGTGVGDLTLTVDGTNFVDAVSFGGGTVPGSQVQWRANGVVTPLTTTYVSPTRLTAVLPSSLLAAPVNASLVVQQPSPATSNAAAFTVAAPTISSIAPTSVPAGSNTTLLTVNGANFTTNGSNGPSVTLNGIPLTTTFVNSGQLTASIPSTLLLAPALSPTVTLTANQNPSSTGQSVTFTALVATPTTGTPTGNVTFKDGGVTLASNVPLSGAGTATFTTSALTAGSHGITATYNGNANFAANTSATLVQIVISGATAMTLEVTPSVPLLGSTAIYKVTLTTSGAPPQGSVSIKDGPNALCSIASLTVGSTSSTGTCNITYDSSNTVHSAGTHNLVAAFAPNPAFSAANAQLTVKVVTAAVSASKPSSSAGDVFDYGVATTFTSILNPPAPPQGSGTVNFYDNGVLIASATAGIPSGSATSPSVLLPAGSHSITAQYTGDSANATSPVSAAYPITVNVSTAKPFLVQVTNPGGTTSNSVPFFVLPPVIAALSPTSAPAGSPDLLLTVSGANYLQGSHVVFRGTSLLASFINSGTLTFTAPASLLVTPGQAPLQVVNPGGTPSNTVIFNVLAPALTILQPASTPAGSPDFVLTASGSNFLTGSQISFNGTPLSTVFANGALTATVPTALVLTPGAVNVLVTNQGGATSATLPFTVTAPTLVSITPNSVPAGSPATILRVTGTNFVPGSQVLIDGASLATTFASSTLLTATVPASLLGAPRISAISVANPGARSGAVTSSLPFTVLGSLSIVTTSLPSGISGANYSAIFTATGGAPPYSWTATGYPPALFINPATGVLSGVLQATGTYTVVVTVTDAFRSVATAQFTLAVAPPPVSITPSGVALPNGTVGVAYSGFVSASGGTAPYAFSLGGGKLPDGLTLSSSGSVTGTPKLAGQFPFGIVVTDANGITGSRDTSITILPAPLTVNGPAIPTPPSVGTPTTITFTGTGGVEPYRFTPCSALPAGLTFSNGVLSGTPTKAGTFTFCVVIADSTGATVTKTVTITVTDTPPPPAKLTLTGTLADGKVGVAYTGQITAAGGSAPYTYSGTGLPDGLTLSAAGAISGTPTINGQFSLSATVTDSKGATASATFALAIIPSDIAILTASLPDGVVGTPYSATLTASGGNKTYTWTITGLPDGLTATAAGVISGTPRTAGKSTVTVSVQDSTGSASARRTTLTLTILPATLVITTATAPNGTVGTAYSLTLQATGGTTPLTFSATGLPSGLAISAAGLISGTPTTPENATIVVTVKDAAGATATKSFAVTVGLPSAPPLNFLGINDTATPLQQPRLSVSLGNPFPVDVVVTLTLSFAPDTGADDPAIQFSSGGRTARITIPAGATVGATDVGVQTGTVAGLITIAGQLQATGQDVTPSPAPRRTIRIAAAAPVIVTGSVTAVRNATGFTVTLSGYVTDREMTQALFTFAGSNLQTTTLTVTLDTLFAQYFGSTASAATGSQFTFTQPFTVTGSTQSITSVTVTLVNKIGQSAAVTANLN